MQYDPIPYRWLVNPGISGIMIKFICSSGCPGDLQRLWTVRRFPCQGPYQFPMK